MSKMGLHDPFGHLKHKLWPKKGWESNCQFDSQPLKVGNHSNFFMCRWLATRARILLETSSQLEFCTQSYGLPKSWESQLWEFQNLGVLGQNEIWVLVPWLGTKYIIKGKVVASPKSGPWWILWICVCSWFVRAPKCSNYALTNLWFGLCRFV